MSRVQLALNVSDLDAAIEFYTRLFATPPAKVRPGYANFAIAEPPLKLVLFAGDGAPGTINHLGVEVESTDLVGQATERLTGEGLATLTEDQTACCYALQEKVWVTAPDRLRWEVYTVLDHVETEPCSCSLEGDELAGRKDEITELITPVLDRVERGESSLTITLNDRPGLEAEVRGLVAKEQECCSFLSYGVRAGDGSVVLEMSGPADAQATLDEWARLGKVVPAAESSSCC